MYAVVDPMTGETVKSYPTINAEQLEGALARADDAYRRSRLSLEERAQALRRIAVLHRERADELARIVVREMGKRFSDALGEAEFTAEIYDYYADTAASLLADEPIELLEGRGSAVVRRSPIGTVLGIMPWNFPLYQVARFAAPTMAVGNSVLLKPAPQCPESAQALYEIFVAAGFSAGEYENVLADHKQIAQIIADRRIRGVSLTGSDRAGAAVAEIAGRHLKKVVLELGGSNPFMVLAADDLDAVVDSAVAARLGNGGQSCNSGKRVIVIDDLYDAFIDKYTAAMAARAPGDPWADGTDFGPLSSMAAAERLEQQVERAVAAGATVRTGGTRVDGYFEPTVLTDIDPDSDVAREEFFGPVAQIYRVKDEAEAITVANDTPYGLGAFVVTPDPDQAQRVAPQLDVGMVFINTINGGGAELPFGGTKRSGFGRELGPYGADEFINKKLIRIG